MDLKKLVTLVLVFTLVFTGTPIVAEASNHGLTDSQLEFVKKYHDWTIIAAGTYGISHTAAEGIFAMYCYESGYGTSYSARIRKNWGGLRKRVGDEYVDQVFSSYEDFCISWLNQITDGYSSIKAYGDPTALIAYLSNGGYCRDAGYISNACSVYHTVQSVMADYGEEWRAEAEAKAEEARLAAEQAAKEEAERQAAVAEFERRLENLERQARSDAMANMVEDVSTSMPIAGVSAALVASMRTETYQEEVDTQITAAIEAAPRYYLGDDGMADSAEIIAAAWEPEGINVAKLTDDVVGRFLESND